MIELELKAVVPDAAELLRRLESLGAHEVFTGSMIDRRLDFPDASLTTRDEVVRLREYRDGAGRTTASIDWKGPATTTEDGYKRREELATSVDDPAVTLTVFRRIGLRVTRSIERDIWQYKLEGATVRVEHYQQMDDLVEVEGDALSIEAAIDAIGIPRGEFSADNLATFAVRFTVRTGLLAITGSEGDRPDGIR